MANVRITNDEFYGVLEQNAVFGPVAGKFQYVLLGRRVFLDDCGAIIYERCEYCGESEIDKRQCCAKCGAPLSGQGKRIKNNTGKNLLYSITKIMTQ